MTAERTITAEQLPHIISLTLKDGGKIMAPVPKNEKWACNNTGQTASQLAPTPAPASTSTSTYNGQLIEGLLDLVDKAILQDESSKQLVRHSLELAYFDGKLQGVLDTVTKIGRER